MYADANDGRPWSKQDLQDLKVCIDSGLTVAQTATALSREGILFIAREHGRTFHMMDGEAYNKP
jgi:hypothetical protein